MIQCSKRLARDFFMKNRKKTVPSIDPGCITCGSCEFIAPEVFEVTDRSRVKKGVDYDAYTDKIKEAAAKCPVNVIRINDNESPTKI